MVASDAAGATGASSGTVAGGATGRPSGGSLMAQEDLDRNAAATPYKLQKAREKGQVARSADLVSALVFATAAVYLAARGREDFQAHVRLQRSLLRHLLDGAQNAAPWPAIAHLLEVLLWSLAPFFLFVALAAIVASLIQTGAVFSVEPLKADFDRLNPASGAKRVFSGRTLFDTARALVKLALLSLVAWQALAALLPQFHRLAHQAPAAIAGMLVEDLGALALKLALLMLFVALLDLAWSRREFARKMRMSQRELKEENRHREGDPRIRARLRELRREMRRRSKSLQQARHADFMLANPTHLTVAMRYVHGEMAAPQLSAKGAGQLAGRLRRLAARHDIPVIVNAPLARRLFREVELSGQVPQDLYAEVAAIVVWVFSMREGRAARNRSALS
jgi:flagellar biosynthetic protein FlhB